MAFCQLLRLRGAQQANLSMWPRSGRSAGFACRQFVAQQKVDVLTMEIEHIDVDALDYVVLHQGVDVQPRPSTLRIIQAGATLRGQASWEACAPAAGLQGTALASTAHTNLGSPQTRLESAA